MTNLLALVAAALFCPWAAQAQGTNGDTTNDVVQLRVTVLDVVPLRDFQGSITQTDGVDLRFALTLRIESCTPAITGLKSGTIVTFAVHSPTLFLRGSAEKGTTYVITMPRKKAATLVLDNKKKQAHQTLQPMPVGVGSSAVAVRAASWRRLG